MDFRNTFCTILLSSSIASALACGGRVWSICTIYDRGPQPRGPAQPLRVRYHYAFLLIVSCHVILSIVTVSVLGALAFVQGEPWHIYLAGSIVFLSMIGQSFWMGGSWFPRQWAFHPTVLACVLVLCCTGLLAGILLMRDNSASGIIVLAVVAGLYRFWIFSQWATFIWEARGVEGRPGGNTLRNTPWIHKMLGHILIQTISTFGLVLACALIGTPVKAWNIRPLMLAISSIVSAAFAFHDASTELWIITTRGLEAIRGWFGCGPSTSTDDVELLGQRPIEQGEDGDVV